MNTLSASELTEKVRAWVIAHRQPGVDVQDLNENTDLIATGVLDSVGFVEMLAYVEGLVGRPVDLSDIDPSEFTKLGGFCTYAAQQVTGTATSAGV